MIEIERELDNLINKYSSLYSVKNSILEAYWIMEETYKKKGKLLIAGNGGSASDAEHIVGELMKSFVIPRPISENVISNIFDVSKVYAPHLVEHLEGALPAIALTAHESFCSAYANDIGNDWVFAQQVLAYGRQEDTLLAISTSGNSKNIINAIIMSKALHIKTIALTGNKKGEVIQYADTVVAVPENSTEAIQELHLPIYHWWCKMLEASFFENNK